MHDTAAQLDATDNLKAQAASERREYLAGVPAAVRKLWHFGSMRSAAGYAAAAIGVGAAGILLLSYLYSAGRQQALESLIASTVSDVRLHSSAVGGDAGIASVIGALILINIWIVNRKLREKNLERDVVINNISHGLVMFDSAARMVVCNDRYRQMYDLPPDVTEPGSTILEFLRHPVASGAFPADAEDYVRDLQSVFAVGEAARHEVKTNDGRIIAIVNQPMDGGGWVATHEDITEAKRREESFHLLFRNNPLPMWVYDLKSLQFLAANEAAIAHYGYSREQFLAMTALDVRPSEQRERFARFVRVTGGVYSGEQFWQHQKADGTVIEVAGYSRILRYEGRIAVLVAIVDVTGHRLTEKALARASQELIEKQYAIDQAVTVTVTDLNGEITYVNDNFCRISGYTPEELIGKNHRMLSSGCHSEAFFQDMFETITRGSIWRGELCNRAKDGSHYWVDTTIVPQLDENGRPMAYMAIRVDITARKLAEEKISYLASHDSLTGLGNRAALSERMGHTLARARQHQEPFAVLLLDLDGFKHINDTLGHAAGDELLKKLAGRLKASLREADYLARFGGDEFAIIQSGDENQRDAAIALAVRMLEIVAIPFDIDGHKITVGTSIGIAVAPSDGVTAKEILQKADVALYRVKAEGRNGFRFFDESMSKDAIARLRLTNDLRVALAHNEFELHYQPILDAETRQPCAVEALVRWRHPVEGLLLPDRFIPLAEESGVIDSLGAWILEKACSDAALWPADIKVAVNLSATQFRSGKLFDIVLRALMKSELPAKRLELEITESALMDNAENVDAIIQQLKNLGITIALDDFGTGYSSLSYLAKIPFDKIKIDKSFTQGLMTSAGCAACVASVLTLARNLDMVVTAEGVETTQQFELLQTAGVHQVQGYLFGRPRPAAELGFPADAQKDEAVAAA